MRRFALAATLLVLFAAQPAAADEVVGRAEQVAGRDLIFGIEPSAARHAVG